MAFSSGTVSIGANTKKSDYDRVLANTVALKDEAIEFSGAKTFQSGTAFNSTATFSSDMNGVPAWGAVGTIVIAASDEHARSTEYLPGTTVTGGSLYYSAATPATNGASLSAEVTTNMRISNTAWQSAGLTGTWRLLSRVYQAQTGGGFDAFFVIGMFQRIT